MIKVYFLKEAKHSEHDAIMGVKQEFRQIVRIFLNAPQLTAIHLMEGVIHQIW